MIEEKRKLIKFSNYSLCVTLPKSVITKLKWVKGDIVSMRVSEDTKEIVISKNKNTDKTLNAKETKLTQKKKMTTQDNNKKARW
jgi:antitoxin component of MazEF toxin-antitoxin module